MKTLDILQALQHGPRSGKQIMEAIPDSHTGVAFYHRMMRLQDAGLIEGWNEPRPENPQLKQRSFILLNKGHRYLAEPPEHDVYETQFFIFEITGWIVMGAMLAAVIWSLYGAVTGNWSWWN